jgi:geranylgeranyl pyrophosphate synthase
VTVGGKRLRPLLALATAEAVASAQGVDDAEALERLRATVLPAACALEFIHTYSLVHDDLPAMDDDALRRGQPTLHVLYGDGVAILAGDALFAEAFALLASPSTSGDPVEVARQRAVLQEIVWAVGSAGMAGGQVIDIACAGLVTSTHGAVPTLDAEGLRDLHMRKTGRLIEASAVVGALLAGGTETQVAAVRRFASDLGVVFQMVDDILDVEGSAASLGKTPGKDAAAGKPTYPAVLGLDTARALVREDAARAARTLDAAGLSTVALQGITAWVIGRSS